MKSSERWWFVPWCFTNDCEDEQNAGESSIKSQRRVSTDTNCHGHFTVFAMWRINRCNCMHSGTFTIVRCIKWYTAQRDNRVFCQWFVLVAKWSWAQCWNYYILFCVWHCDDIFTSGAEVVKEISTKSLFGGLRPVINHSTMFGDTWKWKLVSDLLSS